LLQLTDRQNCNHREFNAITNHSTWHVVYVLQLWNQGMPKYLWNPKNRQKNLLSERMPVDCKVLGAKCTHGSSTRFKSNSQTKNVDTSSWEDLDASLVVCRLIIIGRDQGTYIKPKFVGPISLFYSFYLTQKRTIWSATSTTHSLNLWVPFMEHTQSGLLETPTVLNELLDATKRHVPDSLLGNLRNPRSGKNWVWKSESMRAFTIFITKKHAYFLNNQYF